MEFQDREMYVTHGVTIDETAALASLDGQRDLLRDLAVMFCEDSPKVLQELRQAVDAGDAREARRAVHSLKGLASTFYAHSAVELAQRLENETAGGTVDQLANGGIDNLEQAFVALGHELQHRGLAIPHS